MSKNTCQQDADIALKKAIQQDKWVLLIGGTSEERERLSRVAYQSKECVESDSAFSMYYHKLSRAKELQLRDYGLIFRETKFKWHDCILLDVAGCSSEEMSRKILGPESEKKYKSPNDLLMNKPILNVLIQERTLFIDNFCCKDEDYKDVAKKMSAQLRVHRSKYQRFKLGQLIIGVESKKDYETLPNMFLKQFKRIRLDGIKKVVESAKEIEPEKNQDTESGIKLRIVQNKKEVYWDGNLLHTIRKTDFSILNELAKTPGKLVENENLYELINSDCNKGELLNQRISSIRKAFPPPHSDIKQTQCIIPDAKRNKGYRSLNLSKEQVKIVKK